MNLSKKILFLMAVSCVGFDGFYSTSLQAQETGQGKDSIKTVKLSQAQLKAFEGVYQSSQNKEMNIQFRIMENSLIAKLLWADREIRIVSTSDTSFVSLEIMEGGHLPVTFLRDRQGAFTQVSLGNGDLWALVKDYKPVVKTEIEHTPAQLKTFEGIYQMERNNGLLLQMTEKDNKLVLRQYWDGNEIIFVPDSAMHFFCKEQIIFTLQFIKDGSGKIAQMVAFGRDKWNKARQVHFTPQELKAFEGKYRFKEDHDNLIRIIAKDTGLLVKQLWDGKEIILEPWTESFFYCPAQSYSLNFTKDKTGTITEVLVLNNDVFEKVKE